MKKLLLMMLLILLALAACGGNDSTVETQEASNQQIIQNGTPITDTVTSTLTSESTSELEQESTIQSSVDTPIYISIQEEQFSTALTELDLTRRGLHLTDEEIILLRYMANLRYLNLNFDQISDLTPLADVPNLENLTLIHSSTGLDIHSLASLASLNAFADSRTLTHLHVSLWDADIVDIDFTPLASLTNLTYFGLVMSGGITDISPLTNLTNLTFLGLWHNQINDLSPLAGLTNLTHLDMHFNQITDITPLVNLTNLTFLSLSGNQVTDITPLASLTNLQELWMTNNQIFDISPLASLTNLRGVWLDDNPFTDWSPIGHVHPSVPSPAMTEVPANPHPFAEVLSDFFVNLTTPPYFSQDVPSYHAILVDLDGNGTQGMIATKWSSDRQRYLPYSTGIQPILVQRLYYMYNNQLHEIEFGNWGISPEQRLVAISGANGQGMSIMAYTLFSIVDGNLFPIKSISVTEYQRIEGYGFHPEHDGNSYLISYHEGVDFWNRDWEQDQPLSHEEFNEVMIRYGLHGTATTVWEFSDETYAILSMSAE